MVFRLCTPVGSMQSVPKDATRLIFNLRCS
jgi:hypothetical protein